MNRGPAVERVAPRLDHTIQQSLANRNVDDGARALDSLTFLDLAIVAENHDADIVGFEIGGHAAHAVIELDHLAGLHVVEAVNARNPITHREYLAHFGHF